MIGFALVLALTVPQEEVKDGKTYVNKTHKVALSIPSTEWGALRTGKDIEWKWAGALCEILDKNANVGGCLAAEPAPEKLDDYIKAFEEGLQKNEGSKKLTRHGEPRKLDGDRLRIDYVWEFKEYSFSYVAVFRVAEKSVLKLCLWIESRLWAEYAAAIEGIVESFRSTNAPAKVEHPWAKCGEGSWVEHRTVAKVAGIESESVDRRTLVKKTAEELTFRIETKTVKPTAGDAPTVELRERTALDASVSPKELGRGEEELDVAGKKIKCKWVETEGEADGKKFTTRTWTSDEIPGGVVKSVTNGPDAKSERNLTGFEKK